jgi:hypothetical protein
MRCKHILCTALVAALALGAIGSSDDDDPVAPAAKQYFSISVGQYGGGRGKAPTMDASFAMELPAILPEVTINGVAFTTFGLEGNILYGYRDVPVQDPMTWEVRQGDKVVSGSLALPTMPTTVTCNGSELEYGPTTYLAPATEYVFAWTGGEAEHYRGYFESYDGDNYNEDDWSTSATSIAFTRSPGDDPRYFSLGAFNGAETVPGATPNARGWVDGFVSCYQRDGSFQLGLGPVRSVPPRPPLHELLAAYLR